MRCFKTTKPFFSLAIACAIVLASITARAATFTVTNTLDNGAGSLRQAIIDANAAAGPGKSGADRDVCGARAGDATSRCSADRYTNIRWRDAGGRTGAELRLQPDKRWREPDDL